MPDRVLEGLSVASDGIYLFALDGAYSRLLRVPTGTTKIEELGLPTRGHVQSNSTGYFNWQPDAFADPRAPGVVINLSSWVVPGAEYRYDSQSQRFTDLQLSTPGDINPSDYVVSDLEAKAHDGVMVPLALIEPKATFGARITRLYAYGSYAISTLADFTPRGALATREGIATAYCGVRGGGEKGEAWHLAGKDANKHNTWEDLIACSEYLIAHGITTKDKLFIQGGSAGGIAIGRAITERPDLFAGAIDVVPLANPLRFEFSANGALNIPEFGSVKTDQGFKNLFAMDSIAHVRKGATYPAVMITTGLNDPRVAPWLPAKFAAALQASGTANPILLRVDADAGHGVASSQAQYNDLFTDMISFMYWRGGKPGWIPAAYGN
jgi:prolyl oligopeptidase